MATRLPWVDTRTSTSTTHGNTTPPSCTWVTVTVVSLPDEAVATSKIGHTGSLVPNTHASK